MDLKSFLSKLFKKQGDTKEEEKEIYTLRDAMLEKAFKFEFNEPKLREFAVYCYKISGKETPPVIIVDSPEKAQLIGNIFLPLETLPTDYQKYETMSTDDLKKELGTKKKEYVSFCWRDFSDISWVAYYSYKYSKQKHFSLKEQEQYNKFLEYKQLLIDSGMFVWIALEGVAIIVRPPFYMDLERVDPNNRGDDRVHSSTRPALKFRDGREYYFLHGKAKTKEQWEKEK